MDFQHLNIGQYTQPATDIQIQGTTFFPLGVAYSRVKDGSLGYNSKLADSSLISGEIFLRVREAYLSGVDIPLQTVLAVGRKGSFSVIDSVPVPDVARILIGQKLVGMYGNVVPWKQEVYLLEKLGQKFGFYHVDCDDSTSVSEQDIHIELEQEMEFSR